GRTNLERLWTRLEGRMPYDRSRGAQRDFEWLRDRIRQLFLRRLETGIEGEPCHPSELQRFARHCIKQKCTCITFNYDTLLDRALWEANPTEISEGSSWTPDRGYGFPCRTSEHAVLAGKAVGGPSTMLLLKLHGSLNWRVRVGQPRPYMVDDI